MLIYPIALIAALLLRALSDISVVYLAPIVTRSHLPLLDVTPSTAHSFAPPSLPSGAPSHVHWSTPSNNCWHQYGSCVDLVYFTPAYLAPSAPAIAQPSFTALATLAPPPRASCEQPVRPLPLAPSASWSEYFVDFLVVAGYLGALYWMSLGFAILACIAFHRVASVVDVQRMDSPWSFYSVGLLAETSCVCCRISCAPGLLVPSLSRVPRIARGLRPVPPALATPAPAPVPKKVETTHRGSRGGRRQHRRRYAEDLRQTQFDAASPPSLPPIPPSSAVSVRDVDPRPCRPHLWDAPTGSAPQDSTFTSNGSGRVVSIADGHDTYFIDPPQALNTSTTQAQPAPCPTPTSPPSLAVPSVVPLKTILGRPYSHCDAPPERPAITTFRRKHSPKQTLATVTVRVLPSGKLNQRARRALTAQSTLNNFFRAP
ncbi:hypothetical protein OH77DRAFT_1522800 [Trametes cingulata]|nr:hypothetical protein OH77DRAFT_1522800 [Trametes cingulata]